ncbi:MAG: hypothetical protein MGF17_05670 [Trichodesmium sp. MAG_R04]|nr:hypothetical protein [Trichodesmium sp. MAG_R04]
MWQEKFESTKDKQWDIFAEMVSQEIVVSGTKTLEDVFSFEQLSQVLRNISPVAQVLSLLKRY